MNSKLRRMDTALDNVTPFPGSVRLSTASLHARLVGDVRRLINEGDIIPGARIQEQALCARFGVSRTPLREALKVLAVEGLVTLLPRRGSRVAALDEEQLAQVFEVVCLLEADAGRLACQRIDEASLAEIQALHYQMHASYLRGDLPSYFALNQAVHTAIVAAAANPVLSATHATTAGRIVRARYLANRLDSARWHKAMAEHTEILEALRQRDGAGLAALMSMHLMNKRDAIIAQLREREIG